MASTTRWRDTVVENINQAIQNLIDDVTEEEKVTNIIWENWSIQKCFTDNQTIKLNGKDIIAVPLADESDMRIGYITHKKRMLSRLGTTYLDALKKYLQ